MDLNKSFIVMNSTRTYESFDDQLHSYRVKNHNKFTYDKQHSSKKSIHTCEMSNMFRDENNVNNNTQDNITRNTIAASTIHEWPQNTILVTGDSILNGLEENRLNKKLKVEVRAFPGAGTEDMYDYLAPLLRKKPTQIVLHIGSNDSPDKSSNVILNDILKLRTHIETVLPTVKVCVLSGIKTRPRQSRLYFVPTC